MSLALFAAGYGPAIAPEIVYYVKWALILLGVFAIAYAVLKVLDVKIPPIFLTILWIVLAVAAGLIGINILSSL